MCMYIRDIDQMYAILTATVLASIFKSLKKSLHFNGPYYFDIYTNSKAKPKSKRGIFQCVCNSSKTKGEYNVLQIAFCIVIVTIPTVPQHNDTIWGFT